MRFPLNINVRKEMEDSRLNAIKQLVTFVKGGLNFSGKSTTAATTVFVDMRLSKTKHARKRFQTFRH